MVDTVNRFSSQTAEPAHSLAYYRALELAQFRGGFLARTSHELRSPLNKIISLQQMILEGLCDNPEEEKEFVADAYAAALKLLEHLDFLIHVSKIEMGRIQPQLQQVELAPIFDQVYECTHLQAANRNVRLVVEKPSEEVQVWTDAAWLQNALSTLIDMGVDGCDRGILRLSTASAAAGGIHIWLDDDRSATPWQETMPLPPPAEFDLDGTLPSSLRMGMVEAMVAAMGATLSLVPIPATLTSGTRLQCTVPTQA